MEIMETIREQIEENRIILYMKGSPNQPQCGFSRQVSQILAMNNVPLLLKLSRPRNFSGSVTTTLLSAWQN